MSLKSSKRKSNQMKKIKEQAYIITWCYGFAIMIFAIAAGVCPILTLRHFAQLFLIILLVAGPILGGQLK